MTGETDLVRLTYTIRCYGGCDEVPIPDQARPDLALARHARDTHHAACLIGLPVTSGCDDEPARADRVHAP